ncbi:Solute carrier family 35 member F6 [Lepeophtheirus salmonis]|uniref:Solute carrier family 35 member F6 n=1 Tax=Lepeophtheirus salmonis TaxID=72036 RepID=A0A7R8CTM2_LEPSM|nr:Solute carrier family 35 member F6 [Lepeophtheirus salmonis]CAF2926442.1 Solute carrier family 35 member F6 [Lepeophtheirus salmonis]
MAWTVYQSSLALLMVVTGSINTLSVKWANQIKSVNSVGVRTEFNHPFLQAVTMFLGEMLCMVAYFGTVVYNRNKAREEAPSSDKLEFTWRQAWIFFIPAMLDMSATSIMYVGLTLTSASSFQMLRGAVIIFTGIASMIFLKKKLRWFQWLGMVVVCVGLVLVAVADLLNPTIVKNCIDKGDEVHTVTDDAAYLIPYCDGDSNDGGGSSNEILGDALIIAAQIIVASQMDGKVFFGFIVLSILLIPMAFIGTDSRLWGHSPVPPYVIENSWDGLVQIFNENFLLLSICGTIISIAFFNFAGISVTKELSATTRMVLDSVRTLVIWLVSLALLWQSFHILQVFGFIVLLSGMSLYNDIIIMPLIRKLCLKNDNAEDEVSIVGVEEGDDNERDQNNEGFKEDEEDRQSNEVFRENEGSQNNENDPSNGLSNKNEEDRRSNGSSNKNEEDRRSNGSSNENEEDRRSNGSSNENEENRQK